MTRPEYKLTEIGEVPEEWKIEELSNICVIIRNGLTNKQDTNGVPISRIETISNGNFSDRFGRINSINMALFSNYRIRVGDILISHINSIEHIGKAAIYKGTPKIILHGMNLLLLRFDTNKADPFFYIQYLKYSKTRNRIRSLSKKAVNQASINQSDLSKLLFLLPPLPEQQKMAEILSTADETIQKVNEEITLTEKLKKGLMRTLLTKGIGHTKFKTSEIGEIPEEWSIKSISECGIPVSNIDPSIFSHSYFKYIDVSGISSEKLVIVDTKEIQGIAAPSRARKEVKEEDIIFATVRPYLKRVAIVPKNLDGQVCSTAFCVVRANRNEIMPRFLYYYMTFDKFVIKISGFQTGSAYPAVSDSQVMSERVPIPKLYVAY